MAIASSKRLEPEMLFPIVNHSHHPTSNMEIVETNETVKAEIKKLSSQALQAKLDLHDLSEELPVNWERIPEVAQKTFQAYEKLAAAKKKLAALAG
jgi:hypothetical protein